MKGGDIMKKASHDEYGFPLNFDPSTYYREPEQFVPLPPELFNTVPGMYYISTYGRIYNTILNTYVPRELTRDRNMYIGAQLRTADGSAIHVQMHIAVAHTFCSKPGVWFFGDVKVINHKDGVKWHNEPYNLEIVSQSDNTKHADRTNLTSRPFGEDNGASVLTDDQYRQICELTVRGYLPYQINQIMNIGRDITNICQKIRQGSSETLISQEYDFSNIPRNDYRKFTEDEVRSICLYLQDYPWMKPVEILAALGYDVVNMDKKKLKKYRDTISTIKRRVSYIEIGKDYSF